MKHIVSKPHHLMDIFKLYGMGTEVFVPDSYGHDFHTVANAVIQGEVETIRFVVSSDDICKPCRYHKDGKCTDTLINSNKSKEEHNNKIDTMLFMLLGLTEEVMDFKEVVILFREKLDITVYEKAWPHLDDKERQMRFMYGLQGLDRLLLKM